MVFVIAIDGPTASGKGTLSSQIADHYRFPMMDTGLLYRQVGLSVLQAGGDPNDPVAALAAAQHLAAHYKPNQPEPPDIRGEAASQSASQVGAIPAVRQCLFDLQRHFATAPPALPGRVQAGAVLDGRDIGTVICPDAPVKLFITASAEVRAERRVKQLQSLGIPAMYDHVLQDLLIRDERDRQRATSPTLPAADAVVIDTSTLSREQVLAQALQLIDRRMVSSEIL